MMSASISTLRMEAFSDGVFSIASTLLVLNIALHPHGTPLHQVLGAWPYLGYVVSFLTIGGAWLGHSALTRRLAGADSLLLRINLLLLLVIAFLRIFPEFSQRVSKVACDAGTVAPPSTLDGSRRILVVDDEPSILDAVATILSYEGFTVDRASDVAEALTAMEAHTPQLLVLDVMLPGTTGIQLLERLRMAGNTVPVLLLTARDALEDRVLGLDAGADDYVTKPFALAEIVARVQAILRRTESGWDESSLQFCDVRLDVGTRLATRGDGQLELTATEFNLLRYLMENPRVVLTKDQILSDVWHYDFAGSVGVVETYVSYLRRKLDALGPPLIRTVRGVGFVLRDPEVTT